MSRMLSNLPVTFLTSSGSFDILIEGMMEAVPSGDSVSFSGRIVAGTRTGWRVQGQYDCLRTNGTMEVTTNGA